MIKDGFATLEAQENNVTAYPEIAEIFNLCDVP